MDNAGNLIPTSPLVSDINCMKPGGGTDYADAMAAANTELNLHGRPGVQKIIVLLSDGAANLRQNCVTKTVNGKQVKDTQPHCIQPCQSAVNDDTTYKAQGVLIYTILYATRPPALPARTTLAPTKSRFNNLDCDASHRQPRKLLPRPQPHQPHRHLPTNRVRHGRRHRPHRQLVTRPQTFRLTPLRGRTKPAPPGMVSRKT